MAVKERKHFVIASSGGLRFMVIYGALNCFIVVYCALNYILTLDHWAKVVWAA